jgi:hypothetical protein
MATGTDSVTTRVRVDLRRTWLIWSVLPLAVFLLALLACTAVWASAPVLSPKRAEDSFYMFLAISAIVFLIAFALDGYWTNPRRVSALVARRGEGQGRGERASRVVVTSASALGAMGLVMGLAPILCLAGGAGKDNAYLLLSVAISYHLFLFSRHPYYEQVVEAAESGELDNQPDADARKRRPPARPEN